MAADRGGVMSAARSTRTPLLGLNKPDPGGDVDIWGGELNHNADILDGALLADVAASLYLPLAGGTLTGPLTLAGPPVQPLDAASRAYVDAAVQVPPPDTGGIAEAPIDGGTYGRSMAAWNQVIAASDDTIDGGNF